VTPSIRVGSDGRGQTRGMADDEIEIEIEDPTGHAVATAAGELRTIQTATTVLKAAAALAVALWLLAVITIFWYWWDLSGNGGQGTFTSGPIDNDRLLQVLASTLQATWGYALVAVLAFTGSMLLHGHRLRLLAAARQLD